MKKIVVIFCSILLAWFFLDMTGLYFKNSYLVSQSFKDDWIFMTIYLIVFIFFIIKDKIGKYILDGWLALWFLTQFYFHWFFTITGKGFPDDLSPEDFVNSTLSSKVRNEIICDVLYNKLSLCKS